MELASSNVTNFVQKLPEDILNRIIPYTYQLQSSDLLEDIRNYSFTKQLIDKLYYQYWILYKGESNPEDKWELINDIKLYANLNKSISLGFIDNFRYKWFRHFKLNNNNDFDIFIKKLKNKLVSTQINMFWGILTPHERNEFISITLNENILP